MFRGGLPDDFDHLLVGVDDLERAIAWFEASLGVRAAPGGRHAIWGTHNALLSLGPRRYLEIMALDPSAPSEATALGAKTFGLGPDRPMHVMGWCAGASDLEARVADAGRAGIDIGAPIEGGRDRPDGTRVRWRITPPLFLGDGLVPFFIDWMESVHPSVDAPAGARLSRLEGEHPDPERLWRMLAAVGVRLSVSRGPRARLIVTIDGPAGSITLSDAPSVQRRTVPGG